ncbi:MAG: hypothetical protein IJP68_02430, partial [Selenomonadaceae bacterium]|nr:hypothetical protein [Selenomonadaceae bacterium]
MDVIERYKEALELYKAKKFDEALKILEEVILASPQWKKPLLLKAYILREQEKTVDLFLFAQKILPLFEIESPDEKIFLSDALNLLAMASSKLAMQDSAMELFRLAGETAKNNIEACVEISNAILTANASEKFSADDFKKLYAEYKKYLSDITPYPKKFYAHKRIRVGFLSADFFNHSVVRWSWALLFKLDKNFFEIYCYSATGTPDLITEHISKTVENWRDISKLKAAQAAELIRSDEIDILFDLAGHTAGNQLRVAAYRPATVQISGIGYMNSTGLDCFDYFLTDETCAGDESFFTEKLIRLPHSHICFEATTALEVSAPPCLKKNYVTFGSLNQFSKMTDNMLAAWKKILDAVPNSRLILKNGLLNKEDCREFVGNRLKIIGIDVSRVEMRGYTKEYLQDYGDIDIALDTFPYTGGITTCEALYMGVPVVSLYGDRMGSRVGYSILKNIGLEELAVNSYDDYINIAVALANDWELLKMLRQTLRGMMIKSPLTNSKNYLRE